jgi:hypothetical protein
MATVNWTVLALATVTVWELLQAELPMTMAVLLTANV